MKKIVATAALDAELNTDVCDSHTNADLTISLKIAFRQINPQNGAPTGTYNDFGERNAPPRKIVKWNQAEWFAWKSNFIVSAKKYWNGKFWLINNFNDYAFGHSGIKYIPNLWCCLNIVAIEAGARAHHQIDVVRLDKSVPWFGSHSRLYDNLDLNPVRKGVDTHGKTILQRAHVHEIGHLLGLGHVNAKKPACLATGNASAAACYGVTDYEKYSVMGLGMRLREEHANPWRRAIVEISGKGNVETSTDWVPKMVRQYPRSVSDVMAEKPTSLPRKYGVAQ